MYVSFNSDLFIFLTIHIFGLHYVLCAARVVLLPPIRHNAPTPSGPWSLPVTLGGPVILWPLDWPITRVFRTSWLAEPAVKQTADELVPPPPMGPDFIRTSIYGQYSGSIKTTAHLDHNSHCETSSAMNGSNRWTYPVCIVNTRRV